MTISAMLLVLSYLSMYCNPAKFWFMTIFGLLFLPLLLMNAFLLCWAAYRRSRAIIIPLLALIPSVFIVGRFIRFSEPNASAEDKDGIKIVSYNVGRFMLAQEDEKPSVEACADSVLNFLKSEDADIICLQEFYTRNSKKVMSYLSKKLKGYDIQYFVNVNDHGCYGNVTLSKYRAVAKGKIDFEQSANLALYSDYVIGGEPFRVYNCHFESYNISLSRLATSLEKDYQKTMKDTEIKMKRSIVRRPRQVSKVLEDIENCTENVIIAGDFNDNPMSYTYWRLRKTGKDSFVEAGHGTGATFTRFSPFLRIDYILFPETYNALSHKVIKKNYSDHYPIEAIISK